MSNRFSVPLSVPLSAALVLISVALGAQAPSPEYDETRQLMALVDDAAALVEAEGLAFACGEFREHGTRWFQDEVYVFIFDMGGNAICHPAQPALEGQALLELRDPYGRPIIQNFIRELEGDGEIGWVHYLWPKPDSSTFRWKTSYVRQADMEGGQSYIVGSGLYQMEMERFFVVEQVNDAAELILEQGAAAFPTLRDRASGFRFYDAYVFVLDPDGTMVVNVGFPDLERSNLAAQQDEDGKFFVQEMLAIPAGETAWVDYRWPKPGETDPTRKSSFLRRIERDGREYIVGAGVYFR